MEILGLLDSMESMILDSFKIPMTGKVFINEADILSLIDKMRLVCQKGDGYAKGFIETDKRNISQRSDRIEVPHVSEIKSITKDNLDEKAIEVIQQAYQMAKEIRIGADKYADEVLANLEVTSSRILRTIKNGRSRLSKISDVDIDAGDTDVLSLKKEN